MPYFTPFDYFVILNPSSLNLAGQQHFTVDPPLSPLAGRHLLRILKIFLKIADILDDEVKILIADGGY